MPTHPGTSRAARHGPIVVMSELPVEALLVLSMEPPTEVGPDGKSELPSEAVDPVVVSRDDDAEQSHRRIEEGCGLRPSAFQKGPNRECAPAAPSDVHTRHCGVLIRDRFHGFGVERPQGRSVLGQGVHESERLVVLGTAYSIGSRIAQITLNAQPAVTVPLLGRAWRIEEARRHHRKQREADDPEGGRDRESVAPLRKDVLAFVEQNPKDRQGHDEVGSAIERVPELDEASIGQEPVLDGLLMEQADGAFDADEKLCIVERLLWHAVGRELSRAEPVSAPRVDRVEDAHDQGFLPPVGAMHSEDGT